MSVELIDKIKPKNNGNFPMVDAEDVLMPDGKRLSEIPGVLVVTQAEYDALVAAGTVNNATLYFIKEET